MTLVSFRIEIFVVSPMLEVRTRSPATGLVNVESTKRLYGLLLTSMLSLSLGNTRVQHTSGTVLAVMMCHGQTLGRDNAW